MCGIVGIYRPILSEVSESEIQLMLDKIRYRGPDGEGVYTRDGIGLGHVRLAIQDLSDLAAQPMVSHDGRYVLTYNGEIYNVRDLQRDLRESGVKLKSTGDTEALLEYLALFGVERTLAKIEGMFAFGLWDNHEKTLTLARDRHGIKPLYYKVGSNDDIYFASEMKSLVSSCPEPDMCTLDATILGFGGTWGEPTIFRDIKHVLAGEILVFGKNGKRKQAIFASIYDFVDAGLDKDLRSLSRREATQRVLNDLKNSIDLHLISDAPVGVLISGGVDSSLIAAMASKIYPNLKLFHANVVNDSELQAARQLAKTLDLDFEFISISDQDVIDRLPVVTYHYEMPLLYIDGSCVPFYMVSELVAKAGVKVVLTGEGSDEYFLGYPYMVTRPYIRACQRVARLFQRLVHRLPAVGNLLWPDREADPANQLSNLMSRYVLQEIRSETNQRLSFIRNFNERDSRIMCIDGVAENLRTLLHRNDRLAMAWGVESRFPFLGHALASTAVNLPRRFKVHKTLHSPCWHHLLLCDKWIIRKIAEYYLPRELAYRRKYGFRCRFYNRMTVDKKIFYKGFLSQYYGLSRKAYDYLFETTPKKFLARLLCTEIWGQLFPLGLKVGQVTENLRRYVTLEPIDC